MNNRDAVDGYGISECGSLACLSNPCRNGARCVEVERAATAGDGGGGVAAAHNSIGLAGNRNGRWNRDRLSSGESSSPWSSQRNYGLIPKRGAEHDGDYSMMEPEQEEEDNRNWQCKCPTGYIGPTCEISVCDNNPCQYGGTCIPYPGSGYLCLCPFGKHGHYCEHSEYPLEFIWNFSS